MLFSSSSEFALRLYLINKTELEDLSLKYTNREIFKEIAHKLNETKRSRDKYIDEFIAPLERSDIYILSRCLEDEFNAFCSFEIISSFSGVQKYREQLFQLAAGYAYAKRNGFEL